MIAGDNFLIDEIHQVQGAQATMLSHANIYHHSHILHLYNFYICLIDQHNVFFLIDTVFALETLLLDQTSKQAILISSKMLRQ